MSHLLPHPKSISIFDHLLLTQDFGKRRHKHIHAHQDIKMHILHPPNELLLQIAENIGGCKDLNAFTRSAKQTYGPLNGMLYENNVRDGLSSALFWGRARCKDRTVSKMIDAGASVNYTKRWKVTRVPQPTSRGWTAPLYQVVQIGRSRTYRRIHKQVAKADAREQMLQAALANRTVVASLLLKHGADLHSLDHRGLTPLHDAV